MWGENREKKGNRKSSRQKKPPVSYSDAPATPTAARWLRMQQPCGIWGFSSLGALSARRWPRHSRRESRRAKPLGSCCCPDIPGCRVEGQRQAKSERAARARVWMKSAAASGRRRAAWAPWRLPEQSHGSNGVNDTGDSATEQRITETLQHSKN